MAFLSLICKVNQLTFNEFHFLKYRKENEILEFISIKKQKTLSDVACDTKEWLRRHRAWSHVGVLHPAHDFYPKIFENVMSPPVYLTYSGDISVLKEPLISVVGSRAPQFRFIEWLEKNFTDFLKTTDVALVSGGAIGVDQKASSLAMMSGKRTIQFLPSGLDVIYPRNIRPWLTDKRVLCLSEYIPTQEMLRHHFLVRNRLVAILGSFLLVIQAAQKSGSMITARYAMDFGSDVATLPDFPGQPESSGNLALIKDGAHVLQTVEDLKTLYERLCVKLP